MTEIKYKDTTISVEAGKTVTLNTADKKLTGDISIAFDTAGSFSYKGVTTAIEAGKTANLLCSGKKFGTDVVIVVEKGGSPDGGVDPITREITDSWEQIQTAISSGVYSTRYAVGDTKTMTLTDGTEVDMQIVAFDADNKADGSGKAAISWVSKDLVAKHLMKNKVNGYQNNEGGWAASDMRTWLQNEFYATLPAEVIDGIVEVEKTYYDSRKSSTLTCNDTIWIPSMNEVYGVNSFTSGVSTYYCENSGADYTGFFNGDDARIKNYDGTPWSWWARTSRGESYFLGVNSNGTPLLGMKASNETGVALGFCM